MSPQTVHGMFLPNQYFLTNGQGISTESPLNAFDDALSEAGIDMCNLVYASSIIPPDAVEVKRIRITPGAITFAVVARMDGDEGEVIGAGIGYSKCRGRKGITYGFVAENHGYKETRTVKVELLKRLQRMASSRGLKLVRPRVVTRSMCVPRDHYGCVLVALVYVPFSLTVGQRSLAKKERTR